MAWARLPEGLEGITRLHAAGNAIEEISYHLGEMDQDERREFGAAIERVATEWEAEDPGRGQGDWIRQLPGQLGVC